jgi:hypothetical protein
MGEFIIMCKELFFDCNQHKTCAIMSQISAGAQSHPIGRASVCQRRFCCRLLRFLFSTVHLFAMLPRGFFRQQIPFTRYPAVFTVFITEANQ